MAELKSIVDSNLLFLVPPDQMRDAICFLALEDRQFEFLENEFRKRSFDRKEQYIVKFERALSDLGNDSRLRGRDALRAGSVLRAKHACSSNKGYVEILTEILVERDYELSPGRRDRLEQGCLEGLKSQLSLASNFLDILSFKRLLFGDLGFRDDLATLISDHYPAAAPKITKLFDWAQKTLKERRAVQMSKSRPQIINVHGGNAQIAGNNIINNRNRLTTVDFQTLAIELGRVRSNLSTRPASDVDAQIIGLVAQAEAAAEQRNEGRVKSVLGQISKPAWQAIKSVAPQVTSQVILGFLRSHGLA